MLLKCEALAFDFRPREKVLLRWPAEIRFNERDEILISQSRRKRIEFWRIRVCYKSSWGLWSTRQVRQLKMSIKFEILLGCSNNDLKHDHASTFYHFKRHRRYVVSNSVRGRCCAEARTLNNYSQSVTVCKQINCGDVPVTSLLAPRVLPSSSLARSRIFAYGSTEAKAVKCHNREPVKLLNYQPYRFSVRRSCF